MKTAEEIMTPSEAVQTAEDQLKELLRSGASDAELETAQDELDTARAALAQQGQRAIQRETMRREVEKERLAEAKAARDRAALDAEQAVLADPPVVRIEYAGVHIAIKLFGGRDPVVRQTCEEAVRRTL